MTGCHFCQRSLASLEEVHAVQGLLFCSKDCAIKHFTCQISANAENEATELYDDYAECVAPQDIGIVEEAVDYLTSHVMQYACLERPAAKAIADAVLAPLNQLIEAEISKTILNPVVKILMERDGMTREDAEQLLEYVRGQVIEAECSDDVENIIASYLGLEPDYIFDILM